VNQFSFFFIVRFRKDLWSKYKLKLPPPLKSVATLPCGQLYSFTAQLIPVKVMERRLMTVNIHSLSGARQRSMDASIVLC